MLHASNIINLTYHKDIGEKNDIRVGEQEKQYVYYVGDALDIKVHLIRALELSYASDDVEHMQLQYVNITEKIIDQMSIVYLKPAIRKLMKEDQEDEELTKYYNNLMPINLNSSDKLSHRLAKLNNTSLVHVIFDEHKGKFRYKVIPSYLYDIKYDGTKLTEVSYDKYFIEHGEDVSYKVFWTKETLFRRDSISNILPLPGNEDIENPFGIIPFAVLSLKESVDFWGEGQSDVVNVNEQINLLLTKLINRDIILGSEGTLLTVNLDLGQKGEIVDGVREVRAGVGHPINTEGVKVDDVTPSMQHISFDPQIEKIRGAIDWYIKLIANFNGLNPSTILSEVKDTSDYQKVMDAVEQMEIRRDDIEPCRVFEQERFEITRTINNKFVGTEIGRKWKLKEIPEDIKLFVDFADIEVHLTPTDQRLKWDWELNNNLITIKDIAREINPDLTDEQIDEQLKDNKLINSTLGGTLGTFELLAEGTAQ